MTSPKFYDPAKFAEGSLIRIASLERLEDFARTWKFHNKLQPEQLKYAGRITEVEKSYMYHGGDMLYKLRRVPGIWHEQCLEAV